MRCLKFPFCFSSARFDGSLNMDLNEIAMNLVPFPRLHYLVPSLTPLYTLADVSVPTRRSALWLFVSSFYTFAVLINKKRSPFPPPISTV